MKKVLIIDVSIIVVSITLCLLILLSGGDSTFSKWMMFIFAGIGVVGCIDVYRKRNQVVLLRQGTDNPADNQLVLLDEEGRGIRVWDLAGKVALIIGRENKRENIDIDLSESEYSALVDYQHATMNYASGVWYIEDLYSKNGVRIQKDGGICYHVAKNKPCKLVRGDVIMIANTKLLFE